MRLMIVIPGIGENARIGGYKQVSKIFTKLGYKVAIFQPKWDLKSFSRWCEDYKKFLHSLKSNQNDLSVFGFSFGALIALDSMRYQKYNLVVLASLSPYFDQDIKKLPDMATKMLGKQFVINTGRRMKVSEVKKSIRPNHLYFVYGSEELSILISRVKDIKNRIGVKSKILIAKNIDHYLHDKKYLAALKKIKAPY